MKNLTALSARAPRLLPLLAIGLLTTALPTFAQPDAGAPGMNDNPPNVDMGGRGGGRGGNRGPGGPDGGNRPDMAAMQAQRIEGALKGAGFTDAGTIEAITTYIANRQAARKPLYDAANALSAALSDEKTTEAQMATLWSDFNAALATEKTRTANAEAELDGQTGYSKDPKLAAALTLLGVTGDAMNYLDSGQNGRGGGRGGRGQNGMGGPNGMGGGRGNRGGNAANN